MDQELLESYYEELRDERERRRLQRENELDGYVPPEEVLTAYENPTKSKEIG